MVNDMQNELDYLNKVENSCSSKARYDSKEKAVNAYNTYVKNMKRNLRGKKTNKINHKQRPYKCEICGGWHLTRIK